MQFWGSFRRFQVVLGGTYSSWSQLTHMSGTSVLQRWWNLQPQVWQRKPWNSSFRQKSQKASVKKVFLTCRGRQRQLEVVQGWYQEVLGGFGVVLGGPGVVLGPLTLTKLCVVRGTFSRTSTWSSSPVSHEMSVSQPIGFFSLRKNRKCKYWHHLVWRGGGVTPTRWDCRERESFHITT